MEPDLERTKDQFALLAEYAAQGGMDAGIEFAPLNPVGNLAAAVAVIKHVGKPNFRLLLDAMHFFRSGGKVADLRALDPDLIGYTQLCDVPLQPTVQDYMQEAMFGRFRRKLLKLDEYMASPMLADPLCRMDFCLETDGALAFVVTSADRAGELPQRTVYIAGAAPVGTRDWGRCFFWLNHTDDAFTTAGAVPWRNGSMKQQASVPKISMSH